MTGYFVTGTDTNVGKTVLSALLVSAWNAVYWKPIQTGASEATDRESVREWAEATEDRLPLERFRFDPPVSPHLAAREAGVRIGLEAFEFPQADAARKWIVEGAGGVMVPLNERDLMRDLMRRIGFPVFYTVGNKIKKNTVQIRFKGQKFISFRKIILDQDVVFINKVPGAYLHIFDEF